MTIAFVSVGTPSAVTPNPTPSFPASIAVNDLLILLVVNKYPANGPTTPAGWTLIGQTSGGSGASGVDSGQVYVTVYYKIADGTETGPMTVTIPSSNSSRAQIGRWTKSALESWAISSPAYASFNTPGTAVNLTFGSDPGAIFGDTLLVFGGANSSLYTLAAFPTVTYPGCVMSNPAAAFAESAGVNGDHVRIWASSHVVFSGMGSGPPSFAGTYSGTAGSAPAGAAVAVRLRAYSMTTSNRKRRRR